MITNACWEIMTQPPAATSTMAPTNGRFLPDNRSENKKEEGESDSYVWTLLVFSETTLTEEGEFFS